jgi:hypothetical protein
MGIEGLDAALPIETPSVRLAGTAGELPAIAGGGTLETALQQGA